MRKSFLFCLAILITLAGNIYTESIYANRVLADNPVSYWRLDETSGTTAYDQKGLNNAAYYGSPTLGVQDGLLSGDGTAVSMGSSNDQYVGKNAPQNFPSTAVSVEFWLRSSDTTSDGTPFSYATSTSDNTLLVYNYRNFGFYINGDYVNTGVAGNDGQWNHFVFTWRNSDGALSVYKNSTLAYSGTIGVGAAIASGGYLALGQEQDAVGGAFASGQRLIGSLDEMALYNYVLTQDKVTAHYQAGTTIPEPSSLCFLLLAVVAYAIHQKKA